MMLVSVFGLVKQAKEKCIMECDFAISSMWAAILASFAVALKQSESVRRPTFPIPRSTAVGANLQ